MSSLEMDIMSICAKDYSYALGITFDEAIASVTTVVAQLTQS